MPELPEVETVRIKLHPYLINRTIKKVWYDRPHMLLPDVASFTKGVVDNKIINTSRRGKYLFLHLDNNTFIECHLKMSGRLLIKSAVPMDEYVHVKLTLSNKTQLHFSDPRTFGYLKLITLKELKKRLKSLGPEPLDNLTLEKLYEILQSTTAKIKEVLLDQSLIAGIGNIYANDALWIAKIHPEIPANLISYKESSVLHKAIISVLEESLKAGGSSATWYIHPDGERGSYQNFFKVYKQTGMPCPKHLDKSIEYLKVGGRGTYICPECQQTQDLTLSF